MKKESKRDLFLFTKYFATYLSVVAIFMMLLIPIYNKTHKIIKESVEDSANKKLLEGVAVLDSTIDKMSNITKFVMSNTYFQQLVIKKSPLNYRDYFSIIKFQETLTRLFGVYDMPDKGYCIFENNDVLVSNIMSSDDYKTIYKHHLKYQNITPEEINNTIFNSKQDITFLPAQKIKYMDNVEYNALTCINNIRIYSFTKAAMIYTLNVDDIVDAFSSKQVKENGFMYISDRNSNILLQYNYKGITTIPEISGISSDENIELQTIPKNSKDNKTYYKLNGTKYSIMSEKTIYGNLNIVVGIPIAVFESEINSVLNIIKTYIFVAILLALLFGLIYTFNRLTALQYILKIIRPKVNVPLVRNEYKYISSAFLNISDKNEKYERDMLLLRNSIRTSMIEKLFLNGVYTEIQKKEILDYLKIAIEYFSVVIVDFVNENTEELDNQIIEQNSVIHNYIWNYLENYFKYENNHNNYEGQLIFDYSGNRTNFLIPHKLEDISNTSNISDLMKEIAAQVKENFSRKIGIGISNIGYGIENVHTCYLQARNAMRQMNQQLEVNVNVNVYNAQDNLNYTLLEFNLLQQLSELIVIGEKEAVITLFQRMTNQIKKMTFESEQDIMQLFFTIRNSLTNAQKAITKQSNTIEIPNYNESYSISKLLSMFETTAIGLCDQAMQKKKSNNTTLKNSILKYIVENFMNVNLCAALIADEFNISEKNLFSFVKEQTGKAFGEYVEALRLEKAKDLLTNTDFSVAEISEKVGFNTINTFYKAFNRVYAVAPGKWRKNSSVE